MAMKSANTSRDYGATSLFLPLLELGAAFITLSLIGELK